MVQKKKKTRCASPLTLKKSGIQLCLQWAAALTGPRKPSEVSLHQHPIRPFTASLSKAELQSPAVTPQTKTDKEEVTSPVITWYPAVLWTMYDVTERAATLKDIRALAAPGPPHFGAPLAPSDSRPGTWPGCGDRITPEQPHSYHRTFKYCHHPRTLVLGVRASPTTPLLSTRFSAVSHQCIRD